MSINGPTTLGQCSARNHNCGAHALTHIFVKRLLDDDLDLYLVDGNYDALLSCFQRYHNIEVENFNWNHLKQLFCYYSHPGDREIIMGDVFRLFFTELMEKNDEYKAQRFESFHIILTEKIKKELNLAPPPVLAPLPSFFKPFDIFGAASMAWSWIAPTTPNKFAEEDAEIDNDFLNKSPSTQAFILEIIEDFKIKSNGEVDKFSFLEGNFGAGFYQLPDIDKKIKDFWNTTGFNDWIAYINTPWIFLPIDALTNGAGALGFDMTVTTQQGVWAPDGKENIAPRPFQIQVYNLRGNHYEVELDTPFDARLHNLQVDGFGIFDNEPRDDHAYQFFGLKDGKLSGRKIKNEAAPSQEIASFLKLIPVDDADRQDWFKILNTQGRPDRNLPKATRKTVQSQFLSVLEWAQLQVSLAEKINASENGLGEWYSALLALPNAAQKNETLIAWVNDYLKPLCPFNTLSMEACLGWARENTRLHEDIDQEWSKMIQERAGMLAAFFELYHTAEYAEKNGVYNLIFQQWQMACAHSLDFWNTYKNMPMGYNLVLAEQITDLSISLNQLQDNELLDHVSIWIQENNFLQLYRARTALYPLQFDNTIAHEQAETLSVLSGKRNLLEYDSPDIQTDHKNKRFRTDSPPL